MSKEKIFGSADSQKARRDELNTPTSKGIKEQQNISKIQEVSRAKAALVEKVDAILRQVEGKVAGFAHEQIDYYGDRDSHSVDIIPFDPNATYGEIDTIYDTKFEGTNRIEGEEILYTNPSSRKSLILDHEFKPQESFSGSRHFDKKEEIMQTQGSEVIKIGGISVGLTRVVNIYWDSDKVEQHEIVCAVNGVKISEEEYQNLKLMVEKKAAEKKVETQETDVSRYFDGLKKSSEMNVKINRIVDNLLSWGPSTFADLASLAEEHGMYVYGDKKIMTVAEFKELYPTAMEIANKKLEAEKPLLEAFVSAVSEERIRRLEYGTIASSIHTTSGGAWFLGKDVICLGGHSLFNPMNGDGFSVSSFTYNLALKKIRSLDQAE
jgi:hypothetical protein